MVGVIFSKNRALQLDGTLRSFFLHCRDSERIIFKVIYKATSALHERQYQQLIREYPQVQFISEHRFRNDVLSCLEGVEYVLFLVDDNLFVRAFSLAEVVRQLEVHPEALAFSLRLGKNTTYCYTFDRQQSLPDFLTIAPNIFKYDWTSAELDFGYPLEVSSSIYRVADLSPLLKQMEFANPNVLEDRLAQSKDQFRLSRPLMLTYHHSITFCNPANKVQTVAASNRAGSDVQLSVESLAEKFEQGYRLCVQAYSGFIPSACHQEVPFEWETRALIRHPKISVVITCYNYARYLPEAVESVLGQTDQDFELIIVNDGSTDNSQAVAERLAAAHPTHRIRILNQPNSGKPALARNAGIRLACGEYILCLDADDKIDPTMLEACRKVLDTDPSIGFVYTDRRDFDGVNQVIQAGDYDFRRLRYENHISYCALFRKSAWEEVGGYRANLRGCEDWDFWVACGARGYAGQRIPQPLFWYRRHDTGAFQEALKHFKQCVAQIRLNNREVYEPWAIIEAERTLKGAAANPDGYPLVSVIIPTWNRPDFLARAVRSVLDQTYPNFELVVVNDGGEDVERFISSLNHNKQRITYIKHVVNLGLAAARNTGLRHARGKYIAYLDDDDRFYPDHLETLVSFLEQSEYRVAYTDAWRVHYAKEGDQYVARSKDLLYSYDFNANALLLTNYIPVLTVMHERACLDQCGMFDETLTTHEDWDLWIRMSRLYPFGHIKRVTAEFSWRTDGTTMTSRMQPDFVRTTEIIYRKHRLHAAAIPGVIDAQAKRLAQMSGPDARPAYPCSIIIPVWNKVELTRQCLEALAATPDEPRYEVIIVDNGSTDATPALLAGLGGDVQVIRNEENLGFAKACNQGAKAAKGRYLVFLNNDTIPQPGWLAALVREAEEHADAAVVGSKLLYPDGTIQHAGVAFSRKDHVPYHLYQKAPSEWPAVTRRRELQAVTAACMLVRREAFEAVGGFDEGYRNGFEDVDLCLRIRERGGRIIYQPKSVVIHLEEQTPGRKAHDQENLSRFLERWGGKWWLADEDLLAFEDGMRGEHPSDHSVRWRPLADEREREAWRPVAETQRAGRARDQEGARAWVRQTEHWPADPAVLRWGAQVADALGEAQAAERLWRRVLELKEDPEARLALAKAMLAAGRLEEAEAQLTRIPAGAHGDGEAWLLRAVLAMQRQAFAEAAAAFETALAHGADRRKAGLGLVMARLGLGEAEGSERQKAKGKRQRAEGEGQEERQRAKGKGQKAEGEGQEERQKAKGIEDTEESPARQRAKHAELAWELAAALVEEYPDDAEVIHWLLRAGTVLARWEALAERLARFVQRNPGELAMRFAWAGVLLRCGRVEEARREAETIRLLQPDFEGLAELDQALEAKRQEVEVNSR